MTSEQFYNHCSRCGETFGMHERHSCVERGFFPTITKHRVSDAVCSMCGGSGRMVSFWEYPDEMDCPDCGGTGRKPADQGGE